MNAAFSQPSFRFPRRLGLRGAVTVSFDGAALTLRGAEGGERRIAPAQVARLRSGRDDAVKHGPSYETRLWLSDGGMLAFAVSGTRNAGGYLATMRGFAAAMAADGRLARMEAGTSVAGSLLFPGMMGALFLAASCVALFVLTNQPWWGRLLVPLLPGVMTALGIVAARRSWPRPVASLEEYGFRLEGQAIAPRGAR